MLQAYNVNAFSSDTSIGNPCAVCIYKEWPNDKTLQKIAVENGLAETAFIKLNQNGNPELRWFTVSQEVEFCGYGTLSAAYAYLDFLNKELNQVTFTIRNKKFNEVFVTKEEHLFKVQVPVQLPRKEISDEAVLEALGQDKPYKIYDTDRGDLLIIFNDKSLSDIKPDYGALVKCGYYGYILTAKSNSADYETIYVSPRMTDVWVDPANGASQATLAAYWQKELDETNLHGVSITKTGGDFFCYYEPETSYVSIGGQVTPT